VPVPREAAVVVGGAVGGSVVVEEGSAGGEVGAEESAPGSSLRQTPALTPGNRPPTWQPYDRVQTKLDVSS
jgi:hypothetical protein